MPTVSILIPCYNGARHIRPAIDSVLAETAVDLEVIVVDDNSSDDSVAIVSGYRDPRLRLERNPANLGMGGNWNRAMSFAAGTYIKVLPDDDLLMPGALAAQVAVLEADTAQQLALVFGARRIIDTHGKPLATRGLGGRDRRIPAAQIARSCVRRGTNMIGEPGAVLFRRALSDRVGPFDGSLPFVVDVDYWLRLLAYGDAFYLADPVSAFRVSNESFSVVLGDKQVTEYVGFINRMRAKGLAPASALDMAMGRVNARLQSLARRAFYKLVVR